MSFTVDGVSTGAGADDEVSLLKKTDQTDVKHERQEQHKVVPSDRVWMCISHFSLILLGMVIALLALKMLPHFTPTCTTATGISLIHNRTLVIREIDRIVSNEQEWTSTHILRLERLISRLQNETSRAHVQLALEQQEAQVLQQKEAYVLQQALQQSLDRTTQSYQSLVRIHDRDNATRILLDRLVSMQRTLLDGIAISRRGEKGDLEEEQMRPVVRPDLRGARIRRWNDSTSPMEKNPNGDRLLILITITYTYSGRNQVFCHLLSHVRLAATHHRIFWIVVEDAAVGKTDACVAELLEKSGIGYVYLSAGPSNDKGHLQRELALQYVKQNQIRGVVYNMDDDNAYTPDLYRILHETPNHGVGAFAIVFDGAVEHLLWNKDENGTYRYAGYEGGWGDRRIPMDMGAFSFDSVLLFNVTAAKLWPNRQNPGGESEFLVQLGFKRETLRPLGHGATLVAVTHNGWKQRTSCPFLSTV